MRSYLNLFSLIYMRLSNPDANVNTFFVKQSENIKKIKCLGILRNVK
jgi:hypothetical protein